jgi:hypothetical protein
MHVDYDNLALAQQVLERQAKIHAGAMVSYVQVECTISQADLGVLLAVLKPLADLSVTLGETVFTGVQNVAQFSVDAVQATIDEYVAADEAAAQSINAIVVALGALPQAFVDPRGSTPRLGASEASAPDGYGDSEGWVVDQIVDEYGDLTEQWAPTTLDMARDRVGSWGGPPQVTERNDPKSYLVRPQTSSGEIESLRWSAGPVFGSVDWLFEQLMGFSLIEDVIMKPFAGNWEAVDRTSIAWTNLGAASTAMSENFAALPGQTSSWDGEGSIKFQIAMDAIAAGLIGLSYACEYVSGLAASVAGVSEKAAGLIGDILRKLSNKLLRMAIEAAIPVAGWIVAALETVELIASIVKWVLKIYEIINQILDSICEFIESREKLVQIGFVIEDFVAGLTRTVVRSVNA